jgi:hypothetical protein
MGYNLSDIKAGVVVRPPRVVVIGEEKVGKTTFASQWPSPILMPIDGEDGADALEVAKFPTIKTMAELTEGITALAQQEHQFSTLIVDSLSALEPLLWQDVCAKHKKASVEDFGYGKGYVECGLAWREILQGLDYLRNEKSMAIILIGHAKVKTFSDPTGENFDRFELDLHKSAAADILRWSDCILFAKWKTLSKKTDKGFNQEARKAVRSDRVLCGQTSGAYPAGGRGQYGHLPVEMALSYEAFATALKEAQP